METTKFNSNEIIFTLGDSKFYVNKQKLSIKSLYFSALFSGKYKDSADTEFAIKLNWLYKNVMAFTNWINESNECDKIRYDNFKIIFKDTSISDILELIDIANYFIVDKLIKDLKQIILEYHLNPKNVLHLWLQIRNQPLMKDLRDLSFAMCLERFNDLPKMDIMGLCYEDFIELIGNINLQSDKDFLHKTILDWYNLNSSKFENNKDNFLQIKNLILQDKNYQDVLQCSVTYRFDSYSSFILFIWDGISMTELELNSPFVNNKVLNGARVIFKGFDMYLVGGQFEFKEFNTDVWKYSFLTKVWYHVTRLPQGLKNMIVVFWKTRLYLIGGSGRYRLKFEHQIYYDLDTGLWSNPDSIHGFFTDNAMACTINEKIFVLRSLPYYFDPLNNTWELSSKKNNEYHILLLMPDVRSVQSFDNTLIFLVHNCNKTSIWNLQCEGKKYGIIESSIPISSLVINKNEIIGFHEANNQITISTLHILNGCEMKSKYYYTYNIKNHKLCAKVSLGLFNLINPNSLYKKRPDLIKLI